MSSPVCSDLVFYEPTGLGRIERVDYVACRIDLNMALFVEVSVVTPDGCRTGRKQGSNRDPTSH